MHEVDLVLEEMDWSDEDCEDDEEDPECPIVILTKEEYRQMCKPWRKALIVKVLGRNLGFNIIKTRIYQMWKPKGQMIITDVGNNYYVIRLVHNDDYETTLYSGPWLVAEHYLTV